MNGTDGFLDIHDSHLRVLDGNIHAKSIILDQLDITSSNTTSSTVQFLNGVTAFKTTANVEIGTANLFVDTSTSNVGILTSTPTHTLDVRGTANVEVLRTSSNIEMNGGTFSLGGHMIPSANEQYDIGSAEYKIRDMYVSDNSLWIGDKAKISFDTTEDKLTFLKRKVSDTFIPAKIIQLAIAGEIGNDTTAITNDILGKEYTPGNLGAMKLHHWLQYAKGFQPNIKLSGIFDSTNSDYDSTSTAGNVHTHTVEFTNPTTSIVASGNVEVAKELTVTGNATVSSNLIVSGQVTRTYNPGEIIEELNTVCNGRPVTVQSGTYTPTNVTASQTSSATYTEINGSSITYNKPAGAKRIYYKFACQWEDANNGALTNFKIRIYHNGSWKDINLSRYLHSAQYVNDGNNHGSAWVINEFVFECDADTESQHDGRFTSSKNSYTFDVAWRQHGTGTGYQSKLHLNDWWDGSGTDILHPPQLTIRAIA